MSLLHPNPVSTDRFTFDHDTRTFVAEASDFGSLRDRLATNGLVGPFGRVYDDACDIGLTLVSHVSGTRVVFAVEHEERDREGDLLYWDLLPAQLHERTAGLKVRIFND